MKVNYADYIKKIDVSVLVAEAIFSELYKNEIVKSIGEIANTSSGGTPLRGNNDFYNGEIPWLKSGELNDGYIDKAEECITEKGLSNSSAKLFPEGTLLLAMYGATAGKTGITKIEASTNQAVCALFPKEEVRRDFLYWFLRQQRYKFVEISKGGAQPNISQTVINQTQIPIPDISVQERIISFLFSIQNKETLDLNTIPKEYKDAVIKVFHTKQSVTTIESENFNQLDLLKKLRQQILQDAIQGKLVQQDPKDEHASMLLEKIKTEKEKLIREKKIAKGKPLPEIKKEEIPVEIPINWVWERIGELAHHNSGKTLDSGRNCGKPRKCITTSNLYWGYFETDNLKTILIEDEELERCTAKKGDLLICEGGDAGRAAIWNSESDICFQNHIHRVRFHGNISSSYVYWYFLYLSLSGGIESYRKGMGISNLSGKSLSMVILPLPPLSEQHRIVTQIEQIMNLCDELERTIQKNLKYTKDLLHVALKEALAPG